MKPPTENDADRIAARMATLRGNLDHGIEGIAASGRRLTDWRFYLRYSPTLLPALAAAVGYFAVTRRRSALPARLASPAKIATVAATPAKSLAYGIGGQVLGILATMAAHAAVDFIGRRIQGDGNRQPSESPPPAER